jgi:hypothetical protein
MTPNPGPGDGRVIAFLKAVGVGPVLAAAVTAAGGYLAARMQYANVDQPAAVVATSA